MATAERRDFAAHIQQIELEERALIDVAAGIMRPSKKVYPSDLFLMGAVKRALSTARGFRSLMADRNFSCSGVLVRLQIDTSARIFALRLVPSREALINRVMLDGVRFNKNKDSKGFLLSDAHLVSKLSEKYPWTRDVYRETSDLVHLSMKHFYSSLQSVGADRSFKTIIAGEDPERPDEAYNEILSCFAEATRLVRLVLESELALRPQDNG